MERAKRRRRYPIWLRIALGLMIVVALLAASAVALRFWITGDGGRAFILSQVDGRKVGASEPFASLASRATRCRPQRWLTSRWWTMRASGSAPRTHVSSGRQPRCSAASSKSSRSRFTPSMSCAEPLLANQPDGDAPAPISGCASTRSRSMTSTSPNPSSASRRAIASMAARRSSATAPAFRAWSSRRFPAPPTRRTSRRNGRQRAA